MPALASMRLAETVSRASGGARRPGQVAHHIGQEFESVDVLGQERGCGWRHMAATEHGRVDEEVRNEWVACGGRHRQTAGGTVKGPPGS